MFRRLIGWVLVVPFAAIVIALAVANRAPVRVAWNPLEGTATGFGVPLFALVFVVFLLGALCGGLVVWNRQRRWRRAARHRRREVRGLQAELDRVRGDEGPSAVPALAPPR